MAQDSKEVDAMKVDIRERIRNGEKTSAIIAETGYPVAIIKAIKSEEIENDKQAARENERLAQQRHMESKRASHHRKFLIRMGQDPDKKAVDRTASKPAAGEGKDAGSTTTKDKDKK